MPGADKPQFSSGPRDVLAVVAAFPSLDLADPETVVCGCPLFLHAIEHAGNSTRVAKVVVATSRPAIVAAAKKRGVEAVLMEDPVGDPRGIVPTRLVSGTHGDGLPLVVCLSGRVALRSGSEIDGAVKVLDEGDQAVFAAVLLYGAPYMFGDSWIRREQPAGGLVGLATGSFWACRRELLIDVDQFGTAEWSPYFTPWRSQVLVRDEADIRAAESLLGRKRLAPGPLLQDVAMLVLDFDGVFTDNRVLVMQDGTEGVLCSRGDGMGLEMLRNSGLPILVLSKEQNPVVAARCRKLKLECVQGIDDKSAEITRIAAVKGIELSRMAYVGNDTNDLGPMGLVGLPIAVADAHPDCLAAAKLVLGKPGGFGALREICEMLLAAGQSGKAAKPQTGT